jgi:iron complex outermembrane recepter protein
LSANAQTSSRITTHATKFTIRRAQVKLKKLAQAISLTCITGAAFAQTPAPTTAPAKPAVAPAPKAEKIEVTGSSIKRIADEGALPLQIITKEEMETAGIVTAEQLIASLSANGNGLDNLASNADVVDGASRGNNGATAANLRGQGSSATLILLNGRRVAAHGLNGGVVDLNSIPLAAVLRVEVLKDGASAIYGTDAVGGVINFILRKDFQGVTAQAFIDKTEQGGGDIYRVSVVGGFGDLAKDGFNVMASIAHSDNKMLRGSERDFVNTFQSDRGLSVDTRGTPFATVFPLASNNAGVSRTILTSRATPGGALSNTLSPLLPGSTTIRANGGINVLNLPGQAGCNSLDGMQPYDFNLWITPGARFACAWDTARAAVIQQPVKNTNLVSRATFALGNHTLYAEVTASEVESAKTFSNNQISSSTATTSALYNLTYPLNATTTATYNRVFNAIAAVFPSIQENYGQGIAYRWRCSICGPRELTTTSKTGRVLLGAEGSIGTWDYRAGLSQAYSETYSLVGNGYFFNDSFIPALRAGIINPFLGAGESQTPEALAAFQAASAKGVKLYGGRFELSQADASISGALFKLPAGEVMGAAGVDFRTEKWKFQGDERDLANQRSILNVPFDNGNALSGAKRDIRAIYAEVLIPILKTLDVTVAARQDNYTGFGNTTNPKVTFRFAPTNEILFRGSYNTGFRVPTFNQLFNGASISPTSGSGLVDPLSCPSLVASSTVPGCASIQPSTIFGGVATLGPEKSKQASVGFVVSPFKGFTANVDWWVIERTDTIQALSLATYMANYSLFTNRFFRDASGALVAVDVSWINAGETSTKGVELGAKLNGNLGPGKYTAGIDGTYLLEKKSKVVKSVPFGPSEIANFTRSGDLGLRWKHTASFGYRQGNWNGTLTQLYRSGYKDAVLPGVANGTVVPPNLNPTVDSYTLYNVSLTYSGIKNLRLTGGIKNLLNTDPPFSAAYDTNTGAGSSWEPRVGDPRGRAFTFLINYDFK